MGFTRYFEGNVTITPELVQDVNDIINTSNIDIAGWDGTGKPVISTEEIRFNGSGDESCETFVITNGNNGGFCKTAREPYDLVVATVLRRIEETNDDFHADSDGGHDENVVDALYRHLFV